ncbi:MAG: potassium channel protein, partial [Candidatus Marinimicrobia bacterium CG_4_9_14_3_um_filter_48_9]
MIDRRIVTSLILLATLSLVGATGYVILDQVSWFNAFYMTMNTITTVGFREVWQLSRPSQVWTIFIMVAGVGMFFLIVGQIAQQMVNFSRLRRIRMDNSIKNLSDHYILCGFGRMGRAVANEFAVEQVPFVIIETNPEKLEIINNLNHLFIEGDAT